MPALGASLEVSVDCRFDLIGEMIESSKRDTRFAWAAWLQLAQGILMEGLVFVGGIVHLTLRVPEAEIVARTEVFAFDAFNENLYQMMIMGGIFATLRVIASVGLLRKREWGHSLSLMMCAVTFVLMPFMLPAEILDGVLSGGALLLLLLANSERDVKNETS